MPKEEFTIMHLCLQNIEYPQKWLEHIEDQSKLGRKKISCPYDKNIGYNRQSIVQLSRWQFFGILWRSLLRSLYVLYDTNK
jgi:hypothetical protein